MSWLENILLFISYLPVPSFIKLNILIVFEIIYNILNNLILKRKIKFKNSTKLAVITGGSKGIGKETAIKLSKLNYRVIVLGRDISEMEKLKSYGIYYYYIDLANIKNIKNVANIIKEDMKNGKFQYRNSNGGNKNDEQIDSGMKYEKIDILINNAGVYYRKVFKRSSMEYNFLVNHFAHIILTKEFEPIKTVFVSSSVIYSINEIKERNYDFFMENYAQSKLANLLCSYQMKLENKNAVAVHPGIVYTRLFDNTLYGKLVRLCYKIFPFVFTYLEDAADNVIFAVQDEKFYDSNADYYLYKKRVKLPCYVNRQNASKLKLYCNEMMLKNKI